MNIASNYKRLATAATAVLFAVALSACEDGTAEEAGEDIDSAFENMKDSVNDAATDAGNKVEDACEDVKEAAGADNTNC